jgi:hypothetical protein
MTYSPYTKGKVRTSLQSHLNDADVFRRSQNEGGIKFVDNSPLRDLPVNERGTFWDSFSPKPIDSSLLNKQVCSKFVALHNSPIRKAKRAADLEEAAKAYKQSLRDANLCPDCLRPIKYERLQVVTVIPTAEQRERILWRDKYRVYRELDATLREYWREIKDDLAAIRVKSIRRTNGHKIHNWRSAKGEYELSLSNLVNHIKVTTITVATVKSHYRVRMYDGKAYYGLIDGSRNAKGDLNFIRSNRKQERLPNGKMRESQILEYFDNDGRKLIGHMPKDAYRVTEFRCICHNANDLF